MYGLFEVFTQWAGSHVNAFRYYITQKQIRSLQSQVQESKGQLKVTETRLANSNEKLIKAEERLHKVSVRFCLGAELSGLVLICCMSDRH